MHRNNGARAGRNLAPHLSRVQQDRAGIHVGKDGHRTLQEHGIRGRDESQWRDDHLVARSHPGSGQCGVLRRGARAKSHRMCDLGRARELRFQRPHLSRRRVNGAEDPALEDLLNGRLLLPPPDDFCEGDGWPRVHRRAAVDCQTFRHWTSLVVSQSFTAPLRRMLPCAPPGRPSRGR